MNILDSDFYRVNGKLAESAKLIKKDDPTVLKFGSSGFYGEILQSIKDEPNKTRDIVIHTLNGEKLVDILKEKFEVVKHSEPRAGRDAVGARVSVKYIPEIASLDLVTNIIAGDTPVCGLAVLTKILQPNQMINGTFSWSQLVHIRDKHPQHISNGYYSIGIAFNRISNCVMVGINADDTPHEKIPCGFGGVLPWMTKDQYIESLKKQLLAIEHQELRSELIKTLELLSADSDYTVNQPIDILPEIINNDQINELHENLLTSKIPDSMKEKIKKWPNNQMNDIEFAEIVRHVTEQKTDGPKADTEKIPEWLAKNAKWWADGLISENDFVTGIQYLTERGIIRVS